MIVPNANAESAALLGGQFPDKDEEAFRAEAANQRGLSDAAAEGSEVTAQAGAETADTLKGGAGDAFQGRMMLNSASMSTSSEKHIAAAEHLDTAAADIESSKVAMNGVDAEYHSALVQMQVTAAAEGWTPAEVAVAKTDLFGQAQAQIAQIRASFEGAFEGMVASLTSTVDAGGGVPSASSVELPAAGGGGFGAAGAAAAGVGGGGAGMTSARASGQDAGYVAAEFGAGLLSGLAGNTSAGSMGMDQAGMGGMGMGMPGMGYGGMGMGGMGMGGMGMGGMGMGGMGGGSLGNLGQMAQSLGGMINQQAQAGGAGLGVGGQALNDLVAGNAAAGLNPDVEAALRDAGLDPTGDIKEQITEAVAKVADEQGLTLPADSDASEGGGDSELTNNGKGGGDSELTNNGKGGGEPPSTSEGTDNPSTAPSAEAGNAAATATPAATVDPITRLQNDVNGMINNAAGAATAGVDNVANAARDISNTSVGVVQTGPEGAVTANTIGLTGPQHIEAVQTHTSSAGDMMTRPSGAEGLAPASPAAPAAPAAPMAPMMPGSAAPAAAAANPAQPGAAQAPAGAGSSDPYGRHARTDGASTADRSGITSADGTPAQAAARAGGATAFLGLLPPAVAVAHQKMALLRTSQVSSRSVMATALGIFVDQHERTHYVMATDHGVSHLPLSATAPAQTLLLGELELPEGFYAQWCGYADPASKLAAYAASPENAMGTLTAVITSTPVAQLPEAQVIVQSFDELEELVAGGMVAPEGRERADIVGPGGNLGVVLREAMRQEEVTSGDQYLRLLADLLSAVWVDESGAGEYMVRWRRFLVAEAIRAFDSGRESQVWFSLAEHERAAAVGARVLH